MSLPSDLGRLVLGAVLGGGLGYGYYRLVGCQTGACPLTATPLRAILYGSSMGLLLSLTGRK